MIINISKINLSGCSGGGGGDSKVISTKNFEVTANGTTNIVMDQGVDGISAGTITTNVQPTLTAATFDQNGTYTPGSGVDGFNSVTVNVDGSENRLNKFFDNHLTAITQSDLSGVTQIRDYGCYGMSNLKSVDLPPSVTTLYTHAFHGSGIETIDLSNITNLGVGVFSGCTSLTGVTGLENYTGQVPDNLFQGCTALTGNLKVGGQLKQTTSGIFGNCNNLTSITFYYNLNTESGAGTNASAKVFAGCTSIEYLDYTRNKCVAALRTSNPFTAFTQNYEIRVPQSLYNTWINTLSWTASTVVNHIVAYPDVYSSTSITYKTSDGLDIEPVTSYTSTTTWHAGFVSREFDPTTGGTVTMYGLDEIPNKIYSGKSTLISVEIPEGVTSILGSLDNEWANSGSTFSGCTALTSVTLPSTLEYIGGKAFYQCTSLSSITIPDSVTTIGVKAFYNCTGATSLTISSSLDTIASEAFGYCRNLTEITFRGTTPPQNYVPVSLGGGPFLGCNGVGTIYVPAESVQTYIDWINNNDWAGGLRGWTVTAIS